MAAPAPDAERALRTALDQITRLAREVASLHPDPDAALARMAESGIGSRVDLRPQTQDKYHLPEDALPDIDCQNRVHLCKAACCAMRFALTVQDLDEGAVRFDLAMPYVNRVTHQDGHCVHLASDKGCTVYANRPATCRLFDCRGDPRIWADYANYVINPGLVGEDEQGRAVFRFVVPEGWVPPAQE